MRKNEFKANQKEKYSRKVFVGGLPIDTSEKEIREKFGRASGCNNIFVDWPRRSTNPALRHRPVKNLTGYVFLVFDDEGAVEKLLRQCYTEDEPHYLLISSKTMRDKPVQVRPWLITDMHYVPKPHLPLDPRRTVFIGGLPRPTRAYDLAMVVQHYFGPVAYIGIDIDPELKYPKGAARVTFGATKSYVAALQSRYLRIPHEDNVKRVEIKPYILEEQMCDSCYGSQCAGQYARFFCGDPSCLQYLCAFCWNVIHLGNTMMKKRASHRPFVRQNAE